MMRGLIIDKVRLSGTDEELALSGLITIGLTPALSAEP
jgi:hypothetical protein